MNYFLAVLIIALGAAAVAYGGQDDSPGLQLIGVALVVAAVVYGIRAARRRNSSVR